MSWAAHDLEPYAIQKHMKLKVAFVPLLIGSYSPDMMTKWFVYGIHLGPWDLKASDPAQFHRGWPGFGFTHSLLFGVAIGLIIWKVFVKEASAPAVSASVATVAAATAATGIRPRRHPRPDIAPRICHTGHEPSSEGDDPVMAESA